MINIQNIDDNDCFRHLNPANHHPATIKKSDKEFSKRLDFKDTKFPVKIRDIHKIEEKNSIGIGALGYENNEKHPIYVSKNVAKKNMLTYY